MLLSRAKAILRLALRSKNSDVTQWEVLQSGARAHFLAA